MHCRYFDQVIHFPIKPHITNKSGANRYLSVCNDVIFRLIRVNYVQHFLGLVFVSKIYN